MDNAPPILIFFLVGYCLAVVAVFAIARANKTYKDRKVKVSLALLIVLLVVFGLILHTSYG